MEQQTTLVCPSHIIQYISIFIIGIIIGSGSAFVYFKQAPSKSENTYEAGFSAAKKLVEGSTLGAMLRTPDVVLSISGAVTGVSGNRITLHTQPQNPFEDPALIDRIVTIDSNTKIIRLSHKDLKTFQAETDAFVKKMQASKATPQAMVPPEPFTRAIVKLSDIAMGDTLNVAAGENVKLNREFTATEIQIQAKAVIQ